PLSPPSLTLSLPHLFSVLPPRPPSSTLFPYTTLFRSLRFYVSSNPKVQYESTMGIIQQAPKAFLEEENTTQYNNVNQQPSYYTRSEEHTSELQSRFDLVCRLLLEKKKTTTIRDELDAR